MMTDASQDHDELGRTARERSTVYLLLARLWGQEVDADLLDRLKEPDLAQAAADVGIALDPALALAPSDEALAALATEYARLLLGPGPHISATESVYAPEEGEEPSLWGSRAVAVRRFATALGLAYEQDYGGMPDSIDVELDIMGKLTEEEARRWAAGEEEAARRALGLQSKFIDEHLSRWVPRLCSDVADAAELGFYGSLAAATERFVALDTEAINQQAAGEAAHSPGHPGT